MKKISIGICCYNEEENIELIYEMVSKEMALFPQYDYEILFVDNNSTDKSQEILQRICEKDFHVKAIFNQTNFGPERSSINGFSAVSGDAVIALPCDLQEPPEMISQFISEWEKGYDIVWGQKQSSSEGRVKKLCRKVYYSIIDLFSDYKQYKDVIGFGLVDRSVLNVVLAPMIQDPYLNIRHAVAEYGFNIKLVPYEQRERIRGKSSYSLYKYFDFAISSLCNTSTKPLRLMTIMGIISSLLSALIAILLLVYKATHWETFALFTVFLYACMFLFFSILLLGIGILGEYIIIVIRRITDKPVVVEKERLNFKENEQ